MKIYAESLKCLNGHIMERDTYICWKCGSHIETDIMKWLKRLVDNVEKLKELSSNSNVDTV